MNLGKNSQQLLTLQRERDSQKYLTSGLNIQNHPWCILTRKLKNSNHFIGNEVQSNIMILGGMQETKYKKQKILKDKQLSLKKI